VLFLWFATAAAGLALLRAGGAGRAAQPAGSSAAAPVRIGAAPLTAQGKPPPIEHPRSATAGEDHTLLEFSHPALAMTGVACWMLFTFVRYRPLAWISFAVLVVTLLLGLAWLVRSRQAASRQAAGALRFPPRLVLLHGLVAGGSIVLTVLTAVLATRG
jgi:hypothetical protein